VTTLITSKKRVELPKQENVNCWDFVNCGRELGGEKVAELGLCPAAIDTSVNGLNNGKNGGRMCWAVAGTSCGKKISSSFAKKILSCRSCGFFKTVKREEGTEHFCPTKPNVTTI
jgi:hypothetical protein